MGRFSQACIAIVLGCSLLAAEEPSTSATVKKLAETIGEATVKGDYAKVIDYTYEGLVKELGGKTEAIEATETLMKQLTDKGITFKSFKVGDPGEFFARGGNTFVIVPTTAEMGIPNGKIIAKSYLLGISSDGGKTWKFVEGFSLDKKDFRDRILPKLPDKLKLPEKQQPEIIKDK
jgi:hypothetical protein